MAELPPNTLRISSLLSSCFTPLLLAPKPSAFQLHGSYLRFIIMLKPFFSRPHSPHTLRADYPKPRSTWAAGYMVGFSAEMFSMVRTLFPWTQSLWEMWLNFTQVPFHSVPPYLQSFQVKLGSQTSLPARLGLLRETTTIVFKVSVSASDSVLQPYLRAEFMLICKKYLTYFSRYSTHNH